MMISTRQGGRDLDGQQQNRRPSSLNNDSTAENTVDSRSQKDIQVSLTLPQKAQKSMKP